MKSDTGLRPDPSYTYAEVQPEEEGDLFQNSTSTSCKENWKERNIRGWRGGVLGGAILATLVFIINLAITLSTMRRQHPDSKPGRKILFEGDCDKAENINIAAHIVINTLSIILLSASNYAMQCLSAPTRKEIDIAHAKKRWLDIGVLSIRNLRSIRRTRVSLWVLLGLSSLPLHLFYNSAVFLTTASTNYFIFSGNRTDPGPLGLGIGSSSIISQQGYQAATDMEKKIAENQLDRLDAFECANAYAVDFQKSRANVIVAFTPQFLESFQPTNLPIEYSDFGIATIFRKQIGCSADPHSWMCTIGEDVSQREAFCTGDAVCSSTFNRTNWASMVDFCLSDRFTQRCKVQFSTTIAWMLISFNLSKAVALYFVFFMGEDPLMTLGDAISSFLSDEDATTKSLCLMGKENINWWDISERPPRPFHRAETWERKRWYSTVSKHRWRAVTFIFVCAIVPCTALYFNAVVGRPRSTAALMSMGFGTFESDTLFAWSLPTEGTRAVILNSLAANTPQLVLSTLYYTYNSLLTCFLIGHEWSGYATNRKGLRVSAKPAGAQRSTHFLQLPYRFALPLIAVSGFLHWVTSQAIYLASFEEYDTAGVSKPEYVTCGYSPAALIAAVGIAALMFILAILLGTIQFEGEIPIAATCSASISAMCHPTEEEKTGGPAFLPLKWGVISTGNEHSCNEEHASHCTFSSLDVRLPRNNELCAGTFCLKKPVHGSKGYHPERCRW